MQFLPQRGLHSPIPPNILESKIMCPPATSMHRTDATGATAEFRGAFDVIDRDHDGKISRDDLRKFYASVSSAGNEEQEEMITAMISVADANNDGYVQYDEFERVLEGEVKDDCHGGGGVMKDVFGVVDQDGDGRLGFDDIRSFLGRVGLKAGDEEIRDMIRLAGGEEREGVSFGGLLTVLGVQDLVS